MSLKLAIKQFTLRHETPVSCSSLRNEVTSFRKLKSLESSPTQMRFYFDASIFVRFLKTVLAILSLT